MARLEGQQQGVYVGSASAFGPRCQRTNIMWAMRSNIVRTTLGPKGHGQDARLRPGRLVITNEAPPS